MYFINGQIEVIKNVPGWLLAYWWNGSTYNQTISYSGSYLFGAMQGSLSDTNRGT